MVNSRTPQDRIGYGLILLALILVAILCLYPIVYILSVSLSDKAAAEAGQVTILPVGFNIGSYLKILQDRKFFSSFSISAQRVLWGGLLQFALTILSAFALSRNAREFRLRNAYMWFLVFTMLFSGGLIPFYITIKSYKMMDTMWALILPGAVPVYNVILLMNFFRNIPKEMDEVAKLDGAGPWRLMLTVYLPLSLPALATVTLFSIVGHWNSFFDGLIFMNRTENYPLATYIQTLIVQPALTNLSSDQRIELARVSNKTLNAAKIFVSLVPILAIYPFFQRYFVHGIMIGSVKE
jgi:ABC-type glycerol-3-phosphate transport system permease component